jgi:hypothetical protein
LECLVDFLGGGEPDPLGGERLVFFGLAGDFLAAVTEG